MSRDVRVNLLIGTGHFFSHFYQLCLPPLFLVWQREFHVSFAEVGAAAVAMSIAAAALQTPYGFLVDRYGARPFLIGGTDRFDTVLMQETQGRVVAKIGAEGVHSVGIPELGIGFAVKVDDGAQRAQFPAVLRVLQILGVLGDSLSPRLEEFLRRPLRNTRGEVVGEVRLAS